MSKELHASQAIQNMSNRWWIIQIDSILLLQNNIENVKNPYFLVFIISFKDKLISGIKVLNSMMIWTILRLQRIKTCGLNFEANHVFEIPIWIPVQKIYVHAEYNL